MVGACSSSSDSTPSSAPPAGPTTGAATTGPPASASPTGSGSGGLTYRLSSVLGPDGSRLAPPSGTEPIAPDAVTGAECPAGLTIALAGPQSGEAASIGLAARNGAQLAIDEFTAANPGCSVSAKAFDTGGPSGAAATAAAIVADPSVVAVVGPSGSDEVAATGAVFAQAGLAAMSPSATSDDLTDQGFSTFLRGLGTDTHAVTATAASIVGQSGVTKVCLAHAGPPIDLAVTLAPVATATLGAAADPNCDATLSYLQDLTPVVDAIAQAAPQAVYLMTVMPQAAEFVQELRGAGVDATVYLWDVSDPFEYLAEVGDAGVGSRLVCTCQLPTSDFSAAYAAKFGEEPTAWATEGYDLATIALTGIASGAAGDRAAMLAHLRGFDGWGSGRHYQWTSTGELTTPPAFLYEVVAAA